MDLLGRRDTMTSILQEKNQRVRVHQLANLGGLVAIAQLDTIDPALLLGALMNLKERLASGSLHQQRQFQLHGAQKLRERNSEKRAYAYHTTSNAEASSALHLSVHQLKQLIIKLNGKVPVFEKDLIPEIMRLIRE